VYAVLSAALFIGSSRMLSAGVPPLIQGVSILGAGGCALALILGFRLVKAIKNSGNLEEKKG
jgi:ubiquinone biosynthesis protein